MFPSILEFSLAESASSQPTLEFRNTEVFHPSSVLLLRAGCFSTVKHFPDPFFADFHRDVFSALTTSAIKAGKRVSHHVNQKIQQLVFANYTLIFPVHLRTGSRCSFCCHHFKEPVSAVFRLLPQVRAQAAFNLSLSVPVLPEISSSDLIKEKVS